MGIRGLTRLVAAGAVLTGGVIAATTFDDRDERERSTAEVTRVIDGDSVEITSGKHVRIIGIDTPEHGSCGFDAATKAMRQMVEGREVELINPSSVQDLDAYDRLRRFVEVDGRDAGLAQVRNGLASARYDSWDGYDPHPREDRYRSADRVNVGLCE